MCVRLKSVVLSEVSYSDIFFRFNFFTLRGTYIKPSPVVLGFLNMTISKAQAIPKSLLLFLSLPVHIHNIIYVLHELYSELLNGVMYVKIRVL